MYTPRLMSPSTDGSTRLVSHTRWFLIVLVCLLNLSACDNATPHSTNTTTAPVSSTAKPTTPSAPTLEIAPGFTYAPSASWFDLDEGEVEALVSADRKSWGTSEQRKQLLSKDALISAIEINKKFRFYNLTGRWLLATLSVVDENDEPLWTIRLDLPPTGRVSSNLPLEKFANADGLLRLRLTMPETLGSTVNLVDRQIGIPSKPLDSESALKSGYGVSESLEGKEAAAALASSEPHNTDLRALASISEIDSLKSTRWSTTINSTTFSWNTDHWKAMILAETVLEIPANRGNNGGPPDESWWVGVVLRLAENNRQNVIRYSD